MQYLSIDVESTGLDKTHCDVIQFAAILEDANKHKPFNECPKFKRYLRYPKYVGEAYALQLNYKIFQVLTEKFDTGEEQYIVDFYNFTQEFFDWLVSQKFEIDKKGFIHINVVGKNVMGFDIPLLSKLPKWNDKIKVRHRVGDPAILYTDWENDDVFPNLEECKNRAGLPPVVSHDALEDAWDVILLLRKQYKGNYLKDNEDNKTT